MSGGEIAPDFATHYYRASRAPFLNLSDLPGEQAMAVMAELILEQGAWGDSFAAMEATRDFGLAFVPRPYYGRLYRLEDIPDLAARYGIPKPDPEGYDGLAAADIPETFIEIQLWSDEPVRGYFSRCRQKWPA